MNNLFHKLMFPEPDDTGSGDAAPAADNAEAPANPFGDIDFTAEDEQDVQAETEQEATEQPTEEFALTFDEGLDLDDSEKGFFSEAAKEAGLSAEVASKMFSGLVRKVNENNERIAKEQEAAALAELRKSWGKSFDANARQAAQLIKTVGARRGWTVEQMNAFKNPHDMALFYDIAAATGGRLSLGTSNAVAAPKKTKEELKMDGSRVLNEFLDARRAGRINDANRLADEHHNIMKQLTGNPSQPRLLYL